MNWHISHSNVCNSLNGPFKRPVQPRAVLSAMMLHMIEYIPWKLMIIDVVPPLSTVCEARCFLMTHPAVIRATRDMTRLIWLKVISWSLPVSKGLRTCPRRPGWLLKCLKEASEMQRCILGVAWHWFAEAWERKIERSSNPLEVSD